MKIIYCHHAERDVDPKIRRTQNPKEEIISKSIIEASTISINPMEICILKLKKVLPLCYVLLI